MEMDSDPASVYITKLSEADSIDRVGGKAKNLARVQAAGVPVSEAIVLECGALRSTLEVHGLDGPVREYLDSFDGLTSARRAEKHRELTDALLAGGLPPAVQQEVAEGFKSLRKRAPFGLAVRSSAVCEDSGNAGFAGVFDSWLGVMDVPECERRILECWSSLWAPGAVRYMKRMAIEPRVDGMAVMLQQVVSAVSSGVIHTADPDTGDPWQFVVHAVPGLAIELLSGGAVGDSFRVEWDSGLVTNRRITPKLSSLTATGAGVQRVALSAAASDQAALTDDNLTTLSDAARFLDELFALRLDIEFAFTADSLWIVQARPLTATPVFFPHKLNDEDRNRAWERADVVVPLRTDLPAGMLTPMYNDLSDAELWKRHQPDDIVLTVYYTEVRDFHGYRYSLADRKPMFADFFDSPADYEFWLDRHSSVYQKRWDHYADELADLARTASSAIQQTTSAVELIPTMLMLRDQFWDLNSFGWSGPQSLGWMCDMLLSHVLEECDIDIDTGSLVGGGMDSYTFKVTRALQQLGRTIGEPAVRTALETLRLDQVLIDLCGNHPGCRFLADFEKFCWRFGKTPLTWRQRPVFWDVGSDNTALMHTVRCALRNTSRNVEVVHNESRMKRDETEEQVRGMLAKANPEVLPRFNKILKWARYWGQALNDRHELTVGLLWERELIWHVGQRLRHEGVLKLEEEVLLLRREDLEEIAEAPRTRSFGALVARRRQEMHRRLRLKTPQTLGAATSAVSEAAAEAIEHLPSDVNEFTGDGITSCEATGVARCVPDLSSPSLLDVLQPDDILVLPHAYAFHYADWHSILTLVTAVVSPGQLSHHLAQVARECGVPLIGHVSGDLTAIKDGTPLHVDAAKGVVRVLKS